MIDSIIPQGGPPRRGKQHTAWLCALASFTVLTFHAGAVGAPTDKKEAALPPPPPPRSVFVDDPQTGKDPFFPTSARRGTIVQGGKKVPPEEVMPAGLTLKGLSGPPTRRLAIINNVTLAVGEEAVIKVEGKPLRVQCVEIRESSVMVKCNQSPKAAELRFSKEDPRNLTRLTQPTSSPALSL